MRQAPTAEKNSTTSIVPEVRPQAPWRIRELEVLNDFKLKIACNDGTIGIVDLKEFVNSPKSGIFHALSDPHLFGQAHLEIGAVTWPGELDLSPKVMHDEIKLNGYWAPKAPALS